ncbi:MAG: PIN domain-containing protein [Betaproteobacteria bacterium]|nr:PIN domain-containing protein [Betaproteobacteria bacterium]MDE2124916.1 PIN domain-containing protein [Betaproteobacteria bacterium]MDE2186675.1 PIN domain-containing protein [Betaproteobacteria bacterium]MDE2323761.1 PIN domain-containing protein [Betaproteobacteria bacterium]
MNARSFIDTNVLLYADAGDAGDKQKLAVALIRSHMVEASGVVSTQVLQEFAAAGLRKLGLPLELVRGRLEFFTGFEVISASPQAISQALDVRQRWNLSFYDALIVQAAQASGCTELLTEDLQAGATIAGVRVVNPFG